MSDRRGESPSRDRREFSQHLASVHPGQQYTAYRLYRLISPAKRLCLSWLSYSSVDFSHQPVNSLGALTLPMERACPTRRSPALGFKASTTSSLLEPVSPACSSSTVCAGLACPPQLLKPDPASGARGT